VYSIIESARLDKCSSAKRVTDAVRDRMQQRRANKGMH
jgi:hypothetical protein